MTEYYSDKDLDRFNEKGMSLEHITEAVHVTSAVRGGASPIHAIQARNSIEKISL